MDKYSNYTTSTVGRISADSYTKEQHTCKSSNQCNIYKNVNPNALLIINDFDDLIFNVTNNSISTYVISRNGIVATHTFSSPITNYMVFKHCIIFIMMPLNSLGGIKCVSYRDTPKQLFFFDTKNNKYGDILKDNYIIGITISDNDNMMLEGNDVWMTSDLYNYDTIVKDRLIKCSCFSENILILYSGKFTLTTVPNANGYPPSIKYQIITSDNKTFTPTQCGGYLDVGGNMNCEYFDIDKKIVIDVGPFVKWINPKKLIEYHADQKMYLIKKISKDDNTQNECCVCMTEIKGKIALIPCGHTSVCEKCVKMIEPKRCPICKNPYTSILRIY